MGIENYLPKFKFTEEEKKEKGMTEEEAKEKEEKITAKMQTPEVIEKAQSEYEKGVLKQIEKENKE